MKVDNPLLDFSAFPRFDLIRPQQIVPGVTQLLASNRQQIRSLIKTVDAPTWENFMAPLEHLQHQLHRLWSPVDHLHNVCDSAALRKAYQACLPKLTQYADELVQNRHLSDKLKQIQARADYASLSAARRKAIENHLRDFRLGGGDLPRAKQTRYRAISRELADLSNRFSQNLLDATAAWHLDITDEAELDGLPATSVAAAKSAATAAGQNGWRFGLQEATCLPFLRYCNSRGLREKMYRAYATRASELAAHSQFDNTQLIDEILARRYEMARMVGFANYAEYSLATKMADSAAQVATFLRDLAAKASRAAAREWRELREFAQQQDGHTIEAWDLAWLSEKMRQHRFEFSEEELRGYFPLPRVLRGLFETAQRLFGLQITALTARDAAAPTWHQHVQCYRVADAAGQLRGHFYVDLFARDNKRGGAWMDTCIDRRVHAHGVQTPLAFLVCNFSPPADAAVCQLRHDDVVTLFHEFGHTLHHILTQADAVGVAGINGVAWDAVELPSQFLENWCWQRPTLDLISAHVDSGAKLPKSLLDKLKAARNFQSGMRLLKQIEYSLFDLKLHTDYVPGAGTSVQDVLDQVRQEVALLIPPAYNRFQNSFSHIFAGGYAAGYYSYQWAEVLSADAYSLFKQHGVFHQPSAQAFLQHILEPGGAEHPMRLFTDFRGRKPSVDALLCDYGLAAEAVA